VVLYLRVMCCLVLAFTSLPARGTTWYVNHHGGTRFSTNAHDGLCDGTSPAAPSGSKPNQHCAFNDVRYLWTDGSYVTDGSAGSPGWGWIGAGGDTYLIDCAGMPHDSCRIGQSGPNPNDSFGLHGNPTGAGAPTPHSGTPSAHTKILGANWASCSASNRTRLNGGYGVGTVLGMYGTSYVDVSCFDITDFSSCGQSGQKKICAASYPMDDYASNGIEWFNTSTNDTLDNISIHGMSKAGMLGPTGNGVVMKNISITGNASSGWNADDASGKTGTGTLLVQDFDISWNGCAEEYPITDKLPYQDCSDDNGGGYGDGFGTTTTTSNPGWKAHFDRGVVSYNTQDGLDALHLTGAGSSMTITNVLAFGNMGQQIKVGGQQGTSIGNRIVTNCNAMRHAILGTPAGYNARLSDFCRAADTGILLTIGRGSTLTFTDNTIYSASRTGIEIECDGSAGNCDRTSLIDFRGNVFVGFQNNEASGYPGSGSGEYSNPIYMDEGITANPFTNAGSVVSGNTTYFPGRHWACPNHSEGTQSCGDPHLIDETWHIYGHGSMERMDGTKPSSGRSNTQDPKADGSSQSSSGTKIESISAGVLVAAVGAGIWRMESRGK
jgi:hypothetical protein